MPARIHPTRTATLFLSACALCIPGLGQSAPAPPNASSQTQPTNKSREAATPEDRPLPDIPTLMHEVESNQRKAEAIQKDYIYHSVETEKAVDGKGQVKKTTVNEYDHYWVNGVPVRRMTRKDGRELSPGELARENDRIDKQAAKARERRDQGDARGKETDAGGHDEITVSRLLELGAFSNARRVQLNGRDTIAVDYAGDPKAKTRNRGEEVVRDMLGTAWVDEQDHVLSRVEGHFVNAYKVAGGLIVDIRKDTRFTFEQKKVNDEVWLPAHIDAQGSFRALLFVSFNGSFHAEESDYRKFRTSATVLPGFTPVPPASAPADH
jgi:hypothetical protein